MKTSVKRCLLVIIFDLVCVLVLTFSLNEYNLVSKILFAISLAAITVHEFIDAVKNRNDETGYGGLRKWLYYISMACAIGGIAALIIGIWV